MTSARPTLAIGLEKLLDVVEQVTVDDGLVLTGKPGAGMARLTELGAVLEKIGEGTIGEIHPA